jgi:hypothetical protein
VVRENAHQESDMSDLDAAVIGAGHNGLTCAAYLGMAGLKVRVFERRDIAGGACVTEEFHPGFRNSTAAYTVSLLQPRIIADLKLHDQGLRIVERRVQNFLPLPDGQYLLTGEGRTQSEIAKFSARMPLAILPIRPRSDASPACCAGSCSAHRPICRCASSACRARWQSLRVLERSFGKTTASKRLQSHPAVGRRHPR